MLLLRDQALLEGQVQAHLFSGNTRYHHLKPNHPRSDQPMELQRVQRYSSLLQVPGKQQPVHNQHKKGRQEERQMKFSSDHRAEITESLRFSHSFALQRRTSPKTPSRPIGPSRRNRSRL